MKKTSGFDIVWKSIDEENFHRLKGESGFLPYLIPEGPQPKGDEKAFITEKIGLLKGLLYCWGKECKGQRTISKTAWRHLLNKLVSFHGRPSLEAVIIETAQMLNNDFGLWPAQVVLKNGLDILPENAALRGTFLFISAKLAGDVKPKFVKNFIEDILLTCNKLDLSKTDPESKDAFRIMKLAALNALGKTKEMKAYYKKEIMDLPYVIPGFQDMALYLVKKPALPPAKAFAMFSAC